jgi:Uma2 family endonuclease
MEWSDVIADPSLQDLPYKIELNQYGAIVMTPASNRHGRLQVRISNELLKQSSTGQVQVECSVDTPRGVKVADVTWYSDQFEKRHGDATPYAEAPELCIEVLSPSNSPVEMAEKIQLYFEQGAQEVWLCDEAGKMEFHTPQGESSASALFPGFPPSIR